MIKICYSNPVLPNQKGPIYNHCTVAFKQVPPTKATMRALPSSQEERVVPCPRGRPTVPPPEEVCTARWEEQQPSSDGGPCGHQHELAIKDRQI